MTANQTKVLLSTCLLLLVAVIATPFYWYASAHTPAPALRSPQAVVLAPAIAPPVLVSSKVLGPLPAASERDIAPPVIERSQSPERPPNASPFHHSRRQYARHHQAPLHAELQPYRYVFSGKVQGRTVAEIVCLTWQSDLIGEREKTVATGPDGSFIIRGAFPNHPQGQVNWHLMTMPKDGSNPAELSGRLILTEDTNVFLERDLSSTPS